MTKVGVISDTHSLLRPEAVHWLHGSDLILHAGDIGSPGVVEELERVAPVVAIRGNVDKGAWAEKYPPTQLVEWGSHRLYLIHNLRELDLDPAARGIDVVIAGHSHKPKIERRDGVLYLNPGSAGPRRFKLPTAIATLDLSGPEPSAELHELPIQAK